MAERPETMFPILNDKIIRALPWALFAPHERQAQHNHSQSLKRLAERGGLDVVEATMVILDKPWPRDYRQEQVHHYRVVLMQELMKFEHGRLALQDGERR